jgi:Flp pilus assembly CpaE family ATPase
MNAPRLAVLIGTHRDAQALVPALQQSRFDLSHQFLEASQLLEAIDAGSVDVVLVSTGPRGLDLSSLSNLSRRRFPLVVLDSQPHHQRWVAFAGVVLATVASAELVLGGLDAALRGERMRQPVDRSAEAAPPMKTVPADESDSAVELRAAAEATGKIFGIVGGHGAPGRSTLALNLAALLGQVAAVALVDVDRGAPVLAARLGANTNKNLVTVAHMAPSALDEWTAALSRDLQPIVQDDSSHGLFLAGLPRPDSPVQDGFLDALLDALRARFDYVVCDTGVQWLDGDRTTLVPMQRADTVLLVATPDAGGMWRARQALDRLRTHVGPNRIGVVVNQHRSHKDYDRWEIEYALGEPLSAVLPFDPNACWRAVEQRRPVVLTDYRSSLTRSLVQFAERLHGGQIELPRPTATDRSNARTAWLAGKV